MCIQICRLKGDFVSYTRRDYVTVEKCHSLVGELPHDVLNVAKEYFHGAIEYAPPEKAINDNELNVLSFDRSDAMNTTSSFGKDQALIYLSYEDPKGIVSPL